MTCFNSANTTTSETFAWDVSRAVLDCILFILVIVTNLGILVLVAWRWCKEGMPEGNVTSSILVINLSVADFLAGFLGILHFLPRYLCIMDEFFASSRMLCILRFQPVLGAHLSSGYTLIAIAVDRYIAVCHAINYREIVTPRRSLLVIALIWPFAIANSILLFFWNNFDGKECTEFKIAPLGLTLVGISEQIVIMGTVTWAHWKIHRVVQELRRRARQGREARVGGGYVSGGLFAQTTASLDTGAAQQERTGTRAARVLIVILCVNLVTWEPFLILIVIVRTLDVYIPETVMETASSIINFNYIVNPFIYAYNNRPIRKAIKTFLQNMKKKK